MASSTKKLQVLLVEDSEDDAELICHELVEGGFELTRKRVETVQSLKDALKHEAWDVVICDHNLPGLDSSSALKITREASHDLPFIIVSGSIPEDVAIGSMRHGAKDFIRKDNLSRLALVVERELQQSELRLDLKAIQENLYNVSHFDHLTGLANREHLFNHLGSMMSGTGRNCPFAIFMIDVNRFRKITRSLGILAGNKVLVKLAKRLCAAFGEKYFLARYGADKFVVVVPHLDQEEQTGMIVAAINNCLEQSFCINGNDLFVTASIGMGFYPKDGLRPDLLMENVESALYSAKAEGGRSFQAYQIEAGAPGKERLAMESALHRALGQNEFILHYQPQFDLANDRIVGAEALVRWRHPERGMISPADFVPILEDTGLIVPVGEWILRIACAQNKKWQDAGLPLIRMAVNLSAIQFRQPDLVQMVRNSLDDTGLRPEFLELEITENIAINSEESVISALDQLRALGIQLAIDDFGTGYSSLSYLKRFPIDKLKIDQSFIRNHQEGTPDDEIVRAIIAMGHSLKLKVIAEGVETQWQTDFLRRNGCDEVQGYFYGKPMEGNDFALLMQRATRDSRAMA
jgi:diguanylate cyclase (GGDEF)-like protein